jgi:hypothetical protein
MMTRDLEAGTYTQLVAVFTNVFLGMQIPLSAYLQVCFSITNDVVMSISLMYEKAEAGSIALLVSDLLRLIAFPCRPYAAQAPQRPDRSLN